MIVLPTEPGMVIVRQPDHAVLSAEVASMWHRPESFSLGIWKRVLEAVRTHDDGWIQEEQAPTLDPDKQPYDFLRLPAPVHVDVWRRGVRMAARKDPYSALLVAQHARWLTSRTASNSPSPEDREATRTFLGEMGSKMNRLGEQLSRGSREEHEAVQEQNLILARRLFSFFDAVSLMLLGAVATCGKTEPLAFERNVTTLALVFGERELQTVPWPFTASCLELETHALRLPRRSYPDGENLAHEMAQAQAVPLRWEIRPGDPAPGPRP